MKIAVVCYSNMNRSMEAHHILAKKGFNITSFGIGNQVKIPGMSADKPNVYDFNTTYGEMYDDLVSIDKEYYTKSGLLNILDRNRRIKARPERFQNSSVLFNAIFTCEEKVYDQVLDAFEKRGNNLNQPVHVINVEIIDNLEDSIIGAIVIRELCEMMDSSTDLDNDMDEIIAEVEHAHNRTLLHTICFY